MLFTVRRSVIMSCSIAVLNSPGFSPSSSLFCTKTSALSPSHENLALSLVQRSSSSPSQSSPSSPFRLRLSKPPTPLSASAPSASSPPSTSSSSPPSSILKRKRPTRLDIPVASLTFPVPATPLSAARMDLVEADADGYSVYCKRGRRETMEDRFAAHLNLQGDPKQAFFGIFDGHGGAKAAEYASENLGKNMIDEIARRDDDDIEQAVRHGYLNTDSNFLEEDHSRGGSCCVTALIRKGSLIVSNAGDCRAVMSISGVAEAITSDHRPSRPDEKDRIESMGGYVDLCHGVWRIQGCLAVSRGIGDRYLKKWVIAEPETKLIKIQSQHEFLILASDGLWDKVSNQEAVDIAYPFCAGSDKPEPLSACKKLVELSASRGSTDDTSVMIIQLPQYL